MRVYFTWYSYAFKPLAKRQIVDLVRKTHKDECDAINNQHKPYAVSVDARAPQVRNRQQ